MKSLSRLFYLLLLTTGGTLTSAAWAAETPIVRDVFTCNFNDGKDMDDLMSARDYYLNQMEKAGQEPATAFVWVPFKADVGFDFLWANNSENMMVYAERTDAFNGSAEGAASMERFNTVASCSSSLAMRRQMHQSGGEMTPGDGGALINAFACNYRHGHGPADLEDLVNHASDVFESISLEDGSAFFVTVPALGAGPNSADLYFYGVHSSLTAWARRDAAFDTAPGAPSLLRHLQAVIECSSALFHGRRVVPPLE